MTCISDIANVYQGLARARRSAGSRTGDWTLRIIESGDVQRDDWPDPASIRKVGLVHSPRIERHLLRPFDVIVTARAKHYQAALVPPTVSRTVAGVTLLVVRPEKPETGMGHWLWYFLTSDHGRTQLARRLVISPTVTTLSAKNLSEVELPVPGSIEMNALAQLVEASEEAFSTAVKAARLRREALRDSIVHEFSHRTKSTQT